MSKSNKLYFYCAHSDRPFHINCKSISLQKGTSHISPITCHALNTYIFLFISFSLNTHTHMPPYSHTLTHTHSETHTPHTHVTLTNTYTHVHTLSLSRTHSHAHIPIHTHTRVDWTDNTLNQNKPQKYNRWSQKHSLTVFIYKSANLLTFFTGKVKKKNPWQ